LVLIVVFIFWIDFADDASDGFGVGGGIVFGDCEYAQFGESMEEVAIGEDCFGEFYQYVV
jgi:hypothetical protein